MRRAAQVPGGPAVHNPPQLHSNDVRVGAANWLWWGHLHHDNWQMLQTKGLLFCFGRGVVC